LTKPPTSDVAVSVVVATRNRADRLRALLVSLRAQRLASDRFEVVVVDDASDDQTAAVLQDRSAVQGLDLRVVRRERPSGPAAARNDGWRAASGPLIAFTDDDCTVSPRWLEAALGTWDGSSDVLLQGVTQPQPAELDAVGPLARTIRAERLGPYFQACNVFYPRTLLDRLGGFDERAFPRTGEDTDLAWRAMAVGARPLFVPDALVHHAVNRLGPAGALRQAMTWTDSMTVYARFPELRRQVFTHGVFWKRSHYLLVRALCASALPRRARWLAPWLVAPYVLYTVRDRPRNEWHGRGAMLLPLLALVDLVEIVAVARSISRTGRVAL
jgi:glycosyltransferase involved in cell wall biosynthesis